MGSICFFTVKGDALFPKTPTPLPIFGCEFQTISNVLFREKRLFAQRSPRHALLFQQPLGAPEGDLLAFPLPQREFERHFVAQKTKVAPQPFKRRGGPSCPIRATIGGSPLKRPNAYAGGAAPCTLSKVFVGSTARQPVFAIARDAPKIVQSPSATFSSWPGASSRSQQTRKTSERTGRPTHKPSRRS